MEVKPGYKQTEVGVIPEDWGTARIRDLVKHGPQNGYSGKSSDARLGTATLSLSATTSGRMILNDSTIKYLQRQIQKDSFLFLEPGDVLVQRSNTIDLVGTSAIFDGPPKSFIYPDLMMRLRFRNRPVTEWFWRYANSAQGRRHFRSVAAGSTGSMPKISGEKLREMLIPVPPLYEQEAIAEALSDADALIESLEQLIAKKRHIKQGAMQELLTGKRRLPGFEGEWGQKRLGSIADIQRGASPRPIDSPIWFDRESTVGWVRISDVTRSGMFLRETTQRLSPLGVRHSRPVHLGSLIMSICATVGRPIITQIETCIHDGFVVFENLRIDQRFLYYILAGLSLTGPNMAKPDRK